MSDQISIVLSSIYSNKERLANFSKTSIEKNASVRNVCYIV